MPRAIKEDEKSLDVRLRKGLKKIGCWSLKLPTDFVTGLPDRLILIKGGHVIFAEMKGKGLKPEPIQRSIHERLRRLGFKVVVIHTQKTLDETLTEAERLTRLSESRV